MRNQIESQQETAVIGDILSQRNISSVLSEISELERPSNQKDSESSSSNRSDIDGGNTVVAGNLDQSEGQASTLKMSTKENKTEISDEFKDKELSEETTVSVTKAKAKQRKSRTSGAINPRQQLDAAANVNMSVSARANSSDSALSFITHGTTATSNSTEKTTVVAENTEADSNNNDYFAVTAPSAAIAAVTTPRATTNDTTTKTSANATTASTKKNATTSASASASKLKSRQAAIRNDIVEVADDVLSSKWRKRLSSENADQSDIQAASSPSSKTATGPVANSAANSKDKPSLPQKTSMASMVATETSTITNVSSDKTSSNSDLKKQDTPYDQIEEIIATRTINQIVSLAKLSKMVHKATANSKLSPLPSLRSGS